MNQIIKNYMYNTLFQFFSVLLPVITSPILTRTLGEQSLGIYSYTNSIVQIFALLGLVGINLYSTREIAYVRENDKLCNQRFYELFILRIILSMISFCGYILVAVSSEYRKYLFLQSIVLVANALDISWLYSGLEKFKLLVIRSTIIKMIALLLIVFLVKNPGDIYIYILIMVLTILFGNMCLFRYLKSVILLEYPAEINLKAHFIPCLKLFLPQMASQLYLQADKIMIEAFGNNIGELAFYDQAEKIVKLPVCLVTSMSSVLMPRVANEFKKENAYQAQFYTRIALKLGGMLSIPLVFGMWGMANRFIPWFLGEKFQESANLINILAPILIFIALTSVTGNQYMASLNMTKSLTISYGVACIVNVAINFLLIPSMGGRGAAIGTVITEALVLLIQLSVVGKSILNRDIIKSFGIYVISGFIMFYVLGKFQNLDVIGGWYFLHILFGGMVYAFCLYFFKDEFVHKLINSLKRKVG